MRIHIPSHSKQTLGGGHTWRRTFEKYAPAHGAEISGPDDTDAILISGATLANTDDVARWKAQGKKIILRIDNIARNSRNRNTGTSRLHQYAQLADLVIYQSKWAHYFISPFVQRDGPVILNGGDTEHFNTTGPAVPKHGDPQCTFSQFNRDESKNFYKSWYQHTLLHRARPSAHLWLVGQFSPELVEYGFDFFQGERVHYWGVLNDPGAWGCILRSTDVLYAQYVNDACSNTIIEARLCGVPTILTDDSGGTPEIIAAPLDQLTGDYMAKAYMDNIKAI